MIVELLKSVEQLRSNAQNLRRKALQAKEQSERDRLFAAAVAEWQKAITALERGLRTVRRQQGAYTLDVCSVLEALSQSYGSLGGTWRDAGDLRQAKAQYDKGNEYENERRERCGAKDTYNMLQRQIIELLLNPERIRHPNFTDELGKVRDEIKRQFDAGRDDSWGLADLALERLLSGTEADEVIADLERRTAEATFYESTYNLVATLIQEGLGKGDALGTRLEKFKRLLQRKGGIPDPLKAAPLRG